MVCYVIVFYCFCHECITYHISQFPHRSGLKGEGKIVKDLFLEKNIQKRKKEKSNGEETKLIQCTSPIVALHIYVIV